MEPVGNIDLGVLVHLAGVRCTTLNQDLWELKQMAEELGFGTGTSPFKFQLPYSVFVSIVGASWGHPARLATYARYELQLPCGKMRRT